MGGADKRSMNINTTPKFFSHEKADEIAAEMTAAEADEDDGWSYTADHGPEGSRWARVKTLDEDGEFVAFLT